MAQTKSKGQKKTLASNSSHDEAHVFESSSLSPIVGSLYTPTEPISISSKPQVSEKPIQETPEERKRKILAMLSLESNSNLSSDHNQSTKQYVSDSGEEEEEEEEEAEEEKEEEKEEEELSSEGESERKIRFHTPSFSLPILSTPIPSTFSSKPSVPPSTTPHPAFEDKKVPKVHWLSMTTIQMNN